MSFAAGNHYVMVTHDLDFDAIVAVTGGGKPGVVQTRADDLIPERIGRFVIAALDRARTELEQGALPVIDVRRTRLPMLPLTTVFKRHSRAGGNPASLRQSRPVPGFAETTVE